MKPPTIRPCLILLTEADLCRWLGRPTSSIKAAQAVFQLSCYLNKHPQNIPNN
jgi:hypothetical protein